MIRMLSAQDVALLRIHSKSRRVSARDAALLRIQCYGTCCVLAGQGLPYWADLPARWRRAGVRYALGVRLRAAWRQIVLTPPIRE